MGGRQKLIGRFHRLSMKVIGGVEKIGHLKLSVSVNESILNPIKWSRSCVKCSKKVMNGVGVFCRMFFLGTNMPIIPDGLALKLLRRTFKI